MTKILIDSIKVRLNSLQIIKFLHLRRLIIFFNGLRRTNWQPTKLSLMTRIQAWRPRIRDPISGTIKALLSPQIFPIVSSNHPAFPFLGTGALSPWVERRAVEAITRLHLVAMLRVRGTPCMFSSCTTNSGRNSLLRNKKFNYRISLFLRRVFTFKIF